MSPNPFIERTSFGKLCLPVAAGGTIADDSPLSQDASTRACRLLARCYFRCWWRGCVCVRTSRHVLRAAFSAETGLRPPGCSVPSGLCSTSAWR
jgi:hypothetical protein